MEKEKRGCPVNKDHIKGIQCNAKNCVYNDCETYCTADHISVGPNNATCSSETVCSTFREKNTAGK